MRHVIVGSPDVRQRIEYVGGEPKPVRREPEDFLDGEARLPRLDTTDEARRHAERVSDLGDGVARGPTQLTGEEG